MAIFCITIATTASCVRQNRWLTRCIKLLFYILTVQCIFSLSAVLRNTNHFSNPFIASCHVIRTFVLYRCVVNTITRFTLTLIPLKHTFHNSGLESEIIPCHSLQLPMFSPALSGSRPVCSRASASLCTSERANVNWRSREPRSAASRRSSEPTAGTERAWPASCPGDGGSD